MKKIIPDYDNLPEKIKKKIKDILKLRKKSTKKKKK